MAKILRKNQKIWSSNNTDEIIKIGSEGLDGANAIKTTDIEIIQELAAFTGGFSATLTAGRDWIARETLNTLHYIYSTQLSYIFQSGIPEYSEKATYYINSIVKEPNQVKLYKSIIDDNINKPLIDNTAWSLLTDFATMDVSGKADKISGGTNGNLVSRDASGNIADSGISSTIFNIADSLLKLRSDGKIPALDGSLLTNLPQNNTGLPSLSFSLNQLTEPAGNISNYTRLYFPLNSGLSFLVQSGQVSQVPGDGGVNILFPFTFYYLQHVNCNVWNSTSDAYPDFNIHPRNISNSGFRLCNADVNWVADAQWVAMGLM